MIDCIPTLRALAILLISTACLASSCDPDDEPPISVPPTPGDTSGVIRWGDISSVWARDIAHGDGDGGGFTAQLIRPGVLAFLHNGARSNRLYHLDIQTGATVDSFPVESPTLRTGTIDDIDGAGRGEARIGDDYVLRMDTWPFRFSLLDGTIRWIDSNYAYASLINDGQLIGTQSFQRDNAEARINFIDLESGSHARSIVAPPVPARQTFGSPAVYAHPETGRRSVYVNYGTLKTETRFEYTNSRRAYDVASGELLWEHPWDFDSLGRSPNGAPAIVYDSLVIQVGFDTVYAYSQATGREVYRYWGWTRPEDNLGDSYFQYTPPLLSPDGLVYVSSTNTRHFCFEAATGRERYQSPGYGAIGVVQLIGKGMIINSVLGREIEIRNRFTGELLGAFPNPEGSTQSSGFYYDAATRRLFSYSGTMAYCVQLDFVPPGE